MFGLYVSERVSSSEIFLMEGGLGEIKKTLDCSLCIICKRNLKKTWWKTLYHMKLC